MKWIVILLLFPFACHAQGYKSCFSPDGDCESLIVSEINGAEKSIDVAAYSFTSFPVTKALVRAADRGVAVRIILDRGQKLSPVIKYLKSEKMDYRLNNDYAIFHHKFMLIDGRTVQTGSFNYTNRANNRNAENVLIIYDAPFYLDYRKHFNEYWINSAHH